MISREIECVYAKLILKSIRYIYTFIAPQKWFKYSLAMRIWICMLWNTWEASSTPCGHSCYLQQISTRNTTPTFIAGEDSMWSLTNTSLNPQRQYNKHHSLCDSSLAGKWSEVPHGTVYVACTTPIKTYKCLAIIVAPLLTITLLY